MEVTHQFSHLLVGGASVYFSVEGVLLALSEINGVGELDEVNFFDLVVPHNLDYA